MQTQFWVEGGVSARMLEKICLSSEERVFSKRQEKGWRQWKCQMRNDNELVGSISLIGLIGYIRKSKC